MTKSPVSFKTFNSTCGLFFLKTYLGRHQIGRLEENYLVYTTQVNSAFRAFGLVNSDVISKYY